MATAGNNNLASHRLFISILGVVTWVITAVSTVFAILDAASLVVASITFGGLAVAAASLAVVSLCAVGLFLIQYIWRRDGSRLQPKRRRLPLALACILSSATSLILSLITLILVDVNFKEVTQATTGSWTRQLPVKFAIWALACVGQMAFYSSALTISHKSGKRQTPVFAPEPRDSVMSDIREPTPPMPLQIFPTSFAHKVSLASLPSPTFSTTSSQSLRSWRESLQQIVRPVTSRTKLIARHSSLGRDSKSIHSDAQSIDITTLPDGFDTWDTSSVDPQVRDAVMQSVPSRGRVLETIPGSRPASPARALDGPFPFPSSGRQSPALSLPPKIYSDSSRPPSPALSEAHIHPLFRTDSPTPPPAATPGTVVTASPLSGQVISCPPRPYSRMRSNSAARSNSRAASPSPLAKARSFHGSSSRTPSPPSREMTPPIPDFILTSSPRSSFGGGQFPRKISLQSDARRRCEA
ncbi:hypothetical protein K432DRAFT_413399 [Lepidopterella palustris CBS 459.81]|uniref:Uncharacterized protein n=1 Tax=Lepidopterella palustris CBS 459.81 TaxID=1314670 RepID=A0A8E2EK48_9PEZI|nr:hypothetical protein K432DRAFT_413399 [Lepidopterella palustris CBS 459.81]